MAGYTLDAASQNINNPAVTEAHDLPVSASVAGTLAFLGMTFLFGGLLGSRRKRAAAKMMVAVAKKVM